MLIIGSAAGSSTVTTPAMAGWMAADHDTIPFQRGTAEAIGGMTTGATETGAIATGTTDGARLAIPSDDGTVGRIIAGVIPLTGGPLAGTGKTNRRLRRLSVRYASARRLVESFHSSATSCSIS